MERADHGDDESDESFAPEQVRRPKEPKQAAKVQRRVTLMTPVLVTDADLQKTWAKKIVSYKVGAAGGRRWPASWPDPRSALDRMRSLRGHPLRTVCHQARPRAARVPGRLPSRAVGAATRQQAEAGRPTR